MMFAVMRLAQSQKSERLEGEEEAREDGNGNI